MKHYLMPINIEIICSLCKTKLITEKAESWPDTRLFNLFINILVSGHKCQERKNNIIL